MSAPATTGFDFTPRPYQRRVLEWFTRGGFRKKRASLVWHRRAGKDLTALNLIVTAALFDRVGTYVYYYPTYGQAKRSVWDGIDGGGRAFLSYIPKGVITEKNETEMQLKFANGSILQFVGTDRVNQLVGSNPVGCVFSEYSLQSPSAWDLVRPILAENEGWALFIFTPRGRNHGHRLHTLAHDFSKKHPDLWYAETLTVAESTRHDGTPVVRPEAIEQDRQSGMSEDLVQQEFYCSFDAAQVGSYYGSSLAMARQDGRITQLPWDSALPVFTAWDLGVNDTTAIIFFQKVGHRRHLIDFYQNSGEGLGHYAKVLKDKPYAYERHFLPHDISVREWGSGNKRLDTFRSLISSHITVVPKLKIEEGIDAARRVFPRCVFDAQKTAPLIDALAFYHKTWDDKNQTYENAPVHDWSSNPSDAFRYFAVADRDTQRQESQLSRFADSQFSPWGDGGRAESEWSLFA